MIGRLRIPLRLHPAPRRPCPVSVELDSARCGPDAVPEAARLAGGAALDVEVGDGVWRLSWLAERAEELLEVPLAPAAPPFPRITAEPRLAGAAALLVDGIERLVVHYAPAEGKPFCHPLIGPAGISLTRLGQPPDADGRTHSHGLWLGHADLDGCNFWDDREGPGRQRYQSFERFDDGAASGRLTALYAWLAGEQMALVERRDLRLWPLPGGETMLDLTIELSAHDAPVRLARTPFGLLAVRLARTMWPSRGGRIEDSTGELDEAGIQHRRARWCDFAGPVAPGQVNGLAIFDHEQNPEYPTWWHVRDDGWMSPALCLQRDLLIEPAAPLRLRYRLYAHNGFAADAGLDEQHEQWLEPPAVEVGEAVPD